MTMRGEMRNVKIVINILDRINVKELKFVDILVI